MKDNYNNPNRPRVVWKGDKCVIYKPEAQNNSLQNTTAPRQGSREKKSATTATVQRPVKQMARPVSAARTAQEKSPLLSDFLAGLKNKSSFLSAILVIAALSVIVAIAVTTLIPRNVDEVDSEAETETNEATQTEAQVPVTENEVILPDSGEYVVCIDPGHGFDDVGTSNDALGVYEHEVVLAVGLKLREKLEAAGVKVYMTHDTNENPANAPKPYLFGMTKRNGFANTISGVDLFISIHVDAYFEDARVHGPRVYHMDTDTAGGNVAENISLELDELAKDTEVQVKPMHGMNSYQVLRDSDMPAVLVETGFLSNESEAKAMLTDEWRDSMAQALADAIVTSFENKVI